MSPSADRGPWSFLRFGPFFELGLVRLLGGVLTIRKKRIQEIPPNATIELDVELLVNKQSPFGTLVKVIEG